MSDAQHDAPPAAEQIARWALSLRLEDIPPEVLERVKLHILDQFGAQAGCFAMAEPLRIRQYAVTYGRAGGATIIGTDLRLDAEMAALVNGTSGGGFEIDDYGANGANAHPGCAIVPASLAVAETEGASGLRFLLACVASFEFSLRLSLATMPSMFLERGFHMTGSHGVFTSALAYSVLKGFDPATAAHAMAIAGSLAGGTTEYSRSGGEVKRVHGGFGAAGGIRSGRIACLGLTGPSMILEGKRGFLQAVCNTYREEFLTADLGRRWHFIECAAIKPFAACGLMHPHLAAVDRIKAAHAFAPGDIVEIVAGCDPLTLVHTGSAGPVPTALVGAQFSLEFGVAMRLVRGKNDVGAYLDLEAGGFDAPDITAVSTKVRLEHDEECARTQQLGRLTIRLKDGRVLTDTAFAPGSPFNPMSRADVEEKFMDLVSRNFGAGQARRAMDVIMNVETCADLSALAGLFAKDAT